jgi:hypothetical protein
MPLRMGYTRLHSLHFRPSSPRSTSGFRQTGQARMSSISSIAGGIISPNSNSAGRLAVGGSHMPIRLAKRPLTVSHLRKQEQSNRSWHAASRNPGNALPRIGLRSMDTRLGLRRRQTSSCTVGKSKGFPLAELLCTRNKQTPRDSAALPDATTLSLVLVLPSNSAR